MFDPSATPADLPAERLVQIIHFQSEIAKTRMDFAAVLQRTANLAQLLTRADGAVIELVDGSEMVYRAATGIAGGNLGLRLPRGTSISGLCVASGEALFCVDSESDPRVNRDACRAVGLRSLVVVPLMHEGTCEGVLKVVAKRPDVFATVDAHTLALIAGSVAAALAHAGQHGSQVERAETLYLMATRDALTGLANRAFFQEQLNQQLSVARRTGGGLGLVMMDMDGLKGINDIYGHLAGDAAIRTMADRLRCHTRESDVVARLGGDEFVLLLNSAQSRVGAEKAVMKISEGLNGPFVFEGKEHALGASLGLAWFPEDGADVEALQACADQRMYRAKRVRKEG